MRYYYDQSKRVYYLISETVNIIKTQQRAIHKYVKNNYSHIELTIPKDYKAKTKAHAGSHKEGVNSFINRAQMKLIKKICNRKL